MDKEKRGRRNRNRAVEEEQQSGNSAANPIAEQRYSTFREAVLPPDAASALRTVSGASQQGNAARSRSEAHLHVAASSEKQPFKSRLLYLLPAYWQSTYRKAGIGYTLREALAAIREVLS